MKLKFETGKRTMISNSSNSCQLKPVTKLDGQRVTSVMLVISKMNTLKDYVKSNYLSKTIIFGYFRKIVELFGQSISRLFSAVRGKNFDAIGVG